MALNRKVAKCLLQAQIASDEAKGIYIINNDVNAHGRYYGKDIYILTAIKTIIKKKNSGFTFYLTEDKSIDSLLVYFEFTLNGNKYQISFHTYNFDNLSCYFSPQRHKMTWDEKSSRQTALVLSKYLDEN